MRRMDLPVAIGVVAILAATSACSGGPSGTRGTTVVTSNPPSPAVSIPTPSPRVTPAPMVTPSPVIPATFFLGEPGDHEVGTRSLSGVDPARGDRPVTVTLWYPAVAPAGTPVADADPDLAGAPYPLILSSTKLARLIAPIAVSHGFTWASVDGIDSYRRAATEPVDQPRDILFALDLAATGLPEELAGLVDASRVGVTGYSFDGLNTLVLSGARIDPAYFLAQCPTPDALTAPLVAGSLSAFDCGMADDWVTFADHAGPAATPGEDGLWQPLADPRIRAVMPLAGEGWWLFGPRGLAAADRPTLMLAGSFDELLPENAQIYEHLGTPDKAFITLLGEGHMLILSTYAQQILAHFAVAFFGHHLQGRDDLAPYYSEGFVAAREELAWGPVLGR